MNWWTGKYGDFFILFLLGYFFFYYYYLAFRFRSKFHDLPRVFIGFVSELKCFRTQLFESVVRIVNKKRILFTRDDFMTFLRIQRRFWGVCLYVVFVIWFLRFILWLMPEKSALERRLCAGEEYSVCACVRACGRGILGACVRACVSSYPDLIPSWCPRGWRRTGGQDRPVGSLRGHHMAGGLGIMPRGHLAVS